METGEDDIDAIVDMGNAHVKGLSMTRHNLMRPTRDFMVDFYHKYLVTVDEVLGSALVPERQGILRDAIFSSEEDAMLCLYLFMNNITKQLRIDYFNFSDVCQPTSRSKTTMKVLLNLLLYMQSNVNVAKGIMEDIFSKKENYKKVEEEIDRCKNKISRLTSEIGQNEETYLKLKGEAEEIKRDTLELEKQKQQNEVIKYKMIEESNGLEEMLNQHEDYLTLLKNDVANLKSRIISNDDFTASEVRMVKLQEKLKELKSITVSQDSVIQEKKKEKNYLENLTTKFIETIDDISSLSIVEKIEESRVKIEKEKSNNVKTLELIEKTRVAIKEQSEKEKRLIEEIYSQNCKFDSIVAHIKDEQNFVIQQMEKEKEESKRLVAKYKAEEEDLLRHQEDVLKEFQEFEKAQDNLYNNFLRINESVFMSDDLQGIIDQLSKSA